MQNKRGNEGKVSVEDGIQHNATLRDNCITRYSINPDNGLCSITSTEDLDITIPIGTAHREYWKNRKFRPMKDSNTDYNMRKEEEGTLWEKVEEVSTRNPETPLS